MKFDEEFFVVQGRADLETFVEFDCFSEKFASLLSELWIQTAHHVHGKSFFTRKEGYLKL